MTPHQQVPGRSCRGLCRENSYPAAAYACCNTLTNRRSMLCIPSLNVARSISSGCKRRISVRKANSSPKLQQTPGFIGFYLVADETNGISVAVHVWESKARADAFDDVYSRWREALDQYGHIAESDNRVRRLSLSSPNGSGVIRIS